MSESPQAQPEPESLIPLPRLAFQILLALAAGQNHGYGIAKEIRRMSSGRTKPSTGSLYLSMARLAQQGLIEESSNRPPADRDDPRRRYRRLTELGRRVAQAEGERLVGLIDLARRRNLLNEQLIERLTSPIGAESSG